MCDRDFRLPVGSRRRKFPHETFFSPGTNVAGGKFPVYQGEKKSRVENSHDEIRLHMQSDLKSWSPYSNSYTITQLSYKRKLHNSRASAINMYM